MGSDAKEAMVQYVEAAMTSDAKEAMVPDAKEAMVQIVGGSNGFRC